MLTPEQAAKMKCPVARTFGEGKSAKCDGPDCILWRWKPLTTDGRWVKAMKAEQGRLKEAGDKNPHKTAAANIAADPAAHGLPSSPEVGWCGLGGKPDA